MTYRKYIVAAVAAVAVNGLVLAEMGSDSGQTGTSAQPAQPAQSDQTGQMGQSGQMGQMSDQQQLSDQQFAQKASSANHFEIQLSKEASSKLDDPQLKQMAREMQKDHQKAQDQLSKIADKNDIKLSSGVTDPQQKQMLDDLKNKSGSDFQQAFLKDEQQAHQKTIALFQRAQTQVQNQELKDYAQKTLPKLQEHLTMIQQHQGGAQPAGSAIPGSDQNQQQNQQNQPLPREQQMPQDQQNQPGGMEQPVPQQQGQPQQNR